jgi:hypothetical protein
MSKPTERDPQPAIGAGRAYEPSDARVGPVVVTGISLAALMVCGFFGAWVFLDTFQDLELARRPPTSPVYEREIPARPRLQANPGEEWERYQTNQGRFLDSYGYIDRDRGLVHIPVARAADRLLERRQLPRWDKGEAEVRFGPVQTGAGETEAPPPAEPASTAEQDAVELEAPAEAASARTGEAETEVDAFEATTGTEPATSTAARSGRESDAATPRASDPTKTEQASESVDSEEVSP